MFSPKNLTQLAQLIKKSQRILLISHASPDGDTVGSALAWYPALIQMGKTVTNFCVHPMPERFGFLPNIQSYTTELGPWSDYDLVLINDHGDIKLTGLGLEKNTEMLEQCTVVCIDHHFSNEGFGNLRLIDTEAASATQVVYEIFQALKIPITSEMATALLNGLYTDSGSFMHSNTTPDVLQVASDLMSRGANFKAIVRHNFKTLPLARLKLWGKALLKLHQNEKKITSSVVTQQDMDESGADYSDLEGIIDFINSVPDTMLSVLLSERGNVVKGSLRTPRDDIDVSEIAQMFHGGGHRKAAGFALPAGIDVENERWKIVGQI